MGLMWRLYRAGITLLIPTLLLLGGARLLMTESYLWLAYHTPGFPPDPYGFTPEDRLSYAPYAIRYLVQGAPVNYLGDLRQAGGSALFNDRELKHMVDVQQVVQWAMSVLLGLGIGFGVALIVGLRSDQGRRALRQGMISGGGLILFLLIGLVIYILIDWDHFFDSFHNLFFAQGTWQFRYSDSLIRLFPIVFWQNAAYALGGLCAVGGLISIGGGIIWGRRIRREGDQST